MGPKTVTPLPQGNLGHKLRDKTATVNGMNALVSWNLRHLVKLRTRRLVAAMNIREGYAPVDIITPEEVIG